MWISVLESQGGRVNLDLTSRLYILAAAGNTWDIYAKVSGENIRVQSGFVSTADALAAIDHLILNGS